MKKDKEIYDLLNDVQIDWEAYPRQDLNDLEKERMKKMIGQTRKKKTTWAKKAKIAAALVLALGLASQTSLGQAVYAKSESKLQEISYSVGKMIGLNKDLAPYSQVVDQAVVSQGTEIKLNDFILDKDAILFSTLVMPQDQTADGISYDYDLYINGRKILYPGSRGSMGKISDDQVYASYHHLDVKNINLDDQLDVRLVIKNLVLDFYEKDDQALDGQWTFEFTASGKELAAQNHSQALDYQFQIDGLDFDLVEYRSNPILQRLYVHSQAQESVAYDLEFRGQDDQGQEVYFGLSSQDGQDLVFDYSNLQGALSDQVQTLTLTPYGVKLPEGGGKIPDDYQKLGPAFTIHLK